MAAVLSLEFIAAQPTPNSPRRNPGQARRLRDSINARLVNWDRHNLRLLFARAYRSKRGNCKFKTLQPPSTVDANSGSATTKTALPADYKGPAAFHLSKQRFAV